MLYEYNTLHVGSDMQCTLPGGHDNIHLDPLGGHGPVFFLKKARLGRELKDWFGRLELLKGGVAPLERRKKAHSTQGRLFEIHRIPQRNGS